MTATEFCETRLLPVVMAFGFGVLAMGFAVDHREAAALEIAERAIAVAEVYRDACGPVSPAAELSAVDMERFAEARRK